MDNQHKKIKGYRDLSQVEIDLMNRIKSHGENTRKLLDEVELLRVEQDRESLTNNLVSVNITCEQLNTSYHALQLARDHLQTGQMWFVRAVALPESF
jgi:ribosomal 50S subunit-associated protein YjgA (DUF615 family)